VNRLRGFTLVEVLASVGVVSVLIAVLLPALGRARDAARGVVCLSNQRQLGLALALYAGAHAERASPHLATGAGTGGGVGVQHDLRIYWWGAEDVSAGVVDHDRGHLSAYLGVATGERSVFECPAQAWGTYAAQGQVGAEVGGVPTSTYGYNGYGLSPPTTAYTALSGQRWRRLDELERPGAHLVFADAMIVLGALRNTTLLDPPELFSRGRWVENGSPTTSFRHGGRALAGVSDGSVRSFVPAEQAENPLISDASLGSISRENDEHYVQNADDWR
jgi:prepilin-type N-terminal cleavage/methylation domain-containing protein